MIHSKRYSGGRRGRNTKLGNPWDGKGEEEVRTSLQGQAGNLLTEGHVCSHSTWLLRQKVGGDTQ